MSNNLESDRSITTGKMYPIDLAPQKITIVKSVSNSDVKMAHLLPGQPKSSGTSQIIAHSGPISLMRPSTQIISSSVSSQPQMIVSGSPMLQVTQIVSQGSQIIGQGPQIISQSQLIGPGGQIVSPATQIISQGTQLGSNPGNIQGNVSSSGPQVINVGGPLVTGTGNLVVSSTVRTLPPSVRVLPPLPHHNARPGALSSVSLSSNIANVGTGMVVSKTITSHVPRGPAAGASLAVPRVAARPITPVSQAVPLSSLGSWSANARSVRGAVVYSARPPRAPLPTSAPRPHPPIITVASNVPLTPVTSPAPAHSPLPTVVTLASSTVLTSVSSVITGTVRGPSPRAITPNPVQQGPRPLPLLQRNYQPAKVVGVASVNVRAPVGNSAPSQLYYEVSRPTLAPAPAAGPALAPRPTTPFALHHQNNQVNVVTAVRVATEDRTANNAVQPRPSILRKRDIDGSPTKTPSALIFPPSPQQEWEAEAEPDGGGGGGSTTESAASSPAPDDEPPAPSPPELDTSPRKKPRKQMLSSEVRQCDYQTEEPPQPKSPPVRPPPKRPQLSSSYVCGWRATALHFARPSDVRRREPRPRDILAIASQRHVLASAEGWKVHHLTAQMDDLVSLEADVGEQLAGVLRSLEAAPGKAQAALAPHAHALLELVKGNIQRSKIVCEGIQEAREDILRVFTHRTFVSDILSRQADKRCFRKHRSQS